MAFDYTGKTAIVTGGTQGIGLEIAKGIVAVDYRSQPNTFSG